MALSVSIHIHFPPTWLFHGISIKLGAHRPHMWGSSKHTLTFSHLSSDMCGCTSDCCGYDRVQARHWEEGYIACLLVTYGAVGWVGGACNIYDPWSFVDIVPHLKNNTQGLNQVYVQTISLHLQSSSFVGTFLWLPFQHLQTARGKKKKNKEKKQTPVSRSRQLIRIIAKVKKRTAHFQGFHWHLLMLSYTIFLSTRSTQITTQWRKLTENKRSTTWRAAVCLCCSATPALAPPSLSSSAIV